jgi:hypothetical protein
MTKEAETVLEQKKLALSLINWFRALLASPVGIFAGKHQFPKVVDDEKGVKIIVYERGLNEEESYRRYISRGGR